MALEVSRALTVNEAGEPTRTFRSGDRIAFHLYYTASDIPANTRVRATFHIINMVYTVAGSGDDVNYVFRPIHLWQFESLIEPGAWLAWSTWLLPDADPLPGRVDGKMFREHWRMRSWGGPWEFTGVVGPTEPPRAGQFDHNRERWLYQIRY